MVATIRRALAGTAAAVCFAASFAANAASYYSSTWDPPSLVVNAVIQTNGCPSSTTSIQYFPNQGDCTASLYSTVATLNEVDGDLLDPPVYIDFIVPAGAPMDPVVDPNADDVIRGLFFGPTGLVGIRWRPLTALGAFVPRHEDPQLDHEGPWKLSFLNTPLIGDPFHSTALLWDCAHLFCAELEDTADLLFQIIASSAYVPLGDSPPRVARDGSVVPEPGSLALLGSALGIAWMTRRRYTHVG